MWVSSKRSHLYCDQINIETSSLCKKIGIQEDQSRKSLSGICYLYWVIGQIHRVFWQLKSHYFYNFEKFLFSLGVELELSLFGDSRIIYKYWMSNHDRVKEILFENHTVFIKDVTWSIKDVAERPIKDVTVHITDALSMSFTDATAQSPISFFLKLL